jgi:hypothetical protein
MMILPGFATGASRFTRDSGVVFARGSRRFAAAFTLGRLAIIKS